MEFCKDRIFAAVNADELKAGDKVILGDSLRFLRQEVEGDGYIDTLKEVLDESHLQRFKAIDGVEWGLAYLVERAENCTNCVYEGSAGCSVVEICGENKLTHRCHMYKAKDTKRNLCSSCKHSFAECSATTDDIIFGDGVGNDNVYECDKYEQKSTVRCINCEHYSTYEGYCNKQVKPTRYDNTCSDYLLAKPKTDPKAEPHYRPFRDTDELIKVWCEYKCPAHNHRERGLTLPFIWVKRKEANSKGQLITEFGDELHVSMGKEGYNMTDLFVYFTFLDGTPCGVEE